MEPITIVMTTWFNTEDRIKVATETLKSWNELLIYDGQVALHVADDGSELLWEPEKYWGRSLVSVTKQYGGGVGASLNKGFDRAFVPSPLVLYAVDDWKLEQPFNITPWAELLLKRKDVGVVRLGPPHPNTTGTIKPFTDNWQSWALELDRDGYAFGHRPALYHRRFINFYGWFKEGCSAIDCEQDYAVRYNNNLNGPKVIYALPHPWLHVGEESLSELSPYER